MTARTFSALSDAEFRDLVELTKESDSIELKWSVARAEHRKTLAALGMDTLDAQIRHVFFFETPDLDLQSAGVVVRARRIHGRDGDSVIKLRPVVPSELPDELRALPEFGVEIDALPGNYVCSGALKQPVANPLVEATVHGGTPIRKLFTKAQRALFVEHAPAGMALDDLQIFGPIFVLKVKNVPDGFPGKLGAELWLYPDNRWILELSTKCLPSEAFQVAAEARAVLDEAHVVLDAEPQTKTRTALEYFAERFETEHPTPV